MKYTTYGDDYREKVRKIIKKNICQAKLALDSHELGWVLNLTYRTGLGLDYLESVLEFKHKSPSDPLHQPIFTICRRSVGPGNL